MAQDAFLKEIAARFPVMSLSDGADLIALIAERERKWRAYVVAENDYQQQLHHPVTSRYGAERRERATAAARERRDRYAKELGL